MEPSDLDALEPAGILRLRLVQIDDELRALPDDAFAAKHELNVESDEIRKALSEVEGDQTEALKGWAERAGRKGIPLSAEDQWAEGVEAAKGAVGGGEAG